MTRPPFHQRTAFERVLTEETYDLIVRRYAQLGRWCGTARIIFLGLADPSKGKVDGHWLVGATRAKAPGAFPAWLRAECEAARAAFLANPEAA